jgi:hypothetical protein
VGCCAHTNSMLDDALLRHTLACKDVWDAAAATKANVNANDSYDVVFEPWCCTAQLTHLCRSFSRVIRWASTVESFPPEAATATRSPGLKSELLTIV